MQRLAQHRVGKWQLSLLRQRQGWGRGVKEEPVVCLQGTCSVRRIYLLFFKLISTCPSEVCAIKTQSPLNHFLKNSLKGRTVGQKWSTVSNTFVRNQNGSLRSNPATAVSAPSLGRAGGGTHVGGHPCRSSRGSGGPWASPFTCNVVML